MMNRKSILKKVLYFILLLLFILDLRFSFLQHYNQPLESDLVWNSVPHPTLTYVLEYPLGFKAFKEGEPYSNPNKFFSHWSLKEVTTKFPIFLQRFTDPIDSVYLAYGISKLLIQFFLTIVIAYFITGSRNIFKLDFMLAVILVTPFFQNNGYHGIMGIMGKSPTYPFFYALPFLVLMLYFAPFFNYFFHKTPPINRYLSVLMIIPLALMSCLSGPLNPGVALIVVLLLTVQVLYSNYKTSSTSGFFPGLLYSIRKYPSKYWLYLLPISLLSVYSLILGTYNSITIGNAIPILEAYAKLPQGVYLILTSKMAFPVLLGAMAINTVLIRTIAKSERGKQIVRLFSWIGVFTLLYILLLPLGGYRSYRPNLLRHDTMIPITVSLVFWFGVSTLYLFHQLPKKWNYIYIPLIAVVLFIFTNADEAGFDHNDCEIEALKVLANADTNVVAFDKNEFPCTVVDWGHFPNPEKSEWSARMIQMWNITDEKVLYYHK